MINNWINCPFAVAYLAYFFLKSCLLFEPLVHFINVDVVQFILTWWFYKTHFYQLNQHRARIIYCLIYLFFKLKKQDEHKLDLNKDIFLQ